MNQRPKHKSQNSKSLDENTKKEPHDIGFSSNFFGYDTKRIGNQRKNT